MPKRPPGGTRDNEDRRLIGVELPRFNPDETSAVGWRRHRRRRYPRPSVRPVTTTTCYCRTHLEAQRLKWAVAVASMTLRVLVASFSRSRTDRDRLESTCRGKNQKCGLCVVCVCVGCMCVYASGVCWKIPTVVVERELNTVRWPSCSYCSTLWSFFFCRLIFVFCCCFLVRFR